MSLTSSGQIKLTEIRDELGGSGEVSLTEASDGTIATINTGNDSDDRPDGNAPHAMSEFYSYDHDLVTNATFGSWVGSFTSGNTVRLLGTVGGSAVNSGAYSIGITGSSGALLCGRSDSSGDSLDGTLAVALSTSGDPGTGGTSNSAGGYQVIGTSAGSLNLSVSGDVTLYIRFKYTSHAVLTENTLRTFTITNNSVSTTAITSSCLYTSGGGGGGR